MTTSEIKIVKDAVEHHMKKCSNVFLVGHDSPDFDSIGACMGLYQLAKSFGKKAYIIVDDDESRIEPGVKRMMDETRIEPSIKRAKDERKEQFMFIKKKDVPDFMKKDSLLIVADTNKRNMISVRDMLDEFQDRIIVLDHHDIGENTIDTPNLYISLEVSSVSEMVARILTLAKIKYSKEVANALLAGISLDTVRFKQNTTSKTHDVAEKLIDNGAEIEYVNDLFLQEFESFCRISNLIINGTIIRKYSESSLSPIQVSFTLDRSHPHSVYLKEEYAQAADRMMKFKGIDAAFTMGYVDEENVHISARSGKRVNVGAIMDAMKGGGKAQSAGAKFAASDLFEVEEELMSKITLGISPEESIHGEPPVIKVKKMFEKS